MSTIFALATSPGRSGVAVIRVSGPEASRVFSHFQIAPPRPREAALRRLRSPGTQDIIDHGLVLWFKAPASFTGEDVVEFQLHGSHAVIREMLEALGSMEGFRLAERGEFTRRAFLHGRMDLTAVEGLADLIDAETAEQKKQALRALEGEMGALYDSWRSQLVHASAYIEAYLDFPDEDIPDGVLGQLREEVDAIAAAMRRHLHEGRRGRNIREGIRIAIIGPPNAGKSSLINWIARRNVAIVSPLPGTTRDIIEVAVDIGGYPVIFADTAGIRESADVIEQEGVSRARQWAESAEYRLLMLDVTLYTSPPEAFAPLITEDDFILYNHADRLTTAPPLEPPSYLTSLTGSVGMETFMAALEARLKADYATGQSLRYSRERHRLLIQSALAHLERFHQPLPVELLAEELRLARVSVAELLGRIDIEEVLDEVFGSFCIGK